MSISTADLARLLNQEVAEITPLSGGALSEVVRVRLSDGRTLIAKRGGPVATEAQMLRAIAATGCRAPGVLASGDGVLVMTALDEGRGSETGWADAGRNIARLHAARGSAYGWEEPTAFGAATCPAAWSDDWVSFWAERRLLAWPDALPRGIAARLERLASRLADVLPSNPIPALLHGDLWQGNVLLTGDRFSGVIDPACYFGHAEVDLAMLHLFGTPPDSFTEAYGTLAPGWQERRPIYQVWPAIVHLRLFGNGYRGLVTRLLDAAGV